MDETFEEIEVDHTMRIKNSVEEPPTDLELKPLLEHSKYVEDVITEALDDQFQELLGTNEEELEALGRLGDGDVTSEELEEILINYGSIKDLEEIVEKEETRSTLPSDTQSDSSSTQPISRLNMAPSTSNEHDFTIRSDLEEEVKIMEHEEVVTIPIKEARVVSTIPVTIRSNTGKIEEALGHPILWKSSSESFLKHDPTLFRIDKKKRMENQELEFGDSQGFDEVEADDLVTSQVKLEYYSPYKFRPPDTLSVGVSEIPPW